MGHGDYKEQEEKKVGAERLGERWARKERREAG